MCRAAWELAIPVLILVLIFGGFCTLVEAAAVTVLYVLGVEVLVHRDLPAREVIPVVVKCGILFGGVLTILGVAMGLTS